MEISIRRETPADHQAVENLTREAFWNVHVPGCDEHYLVRILRDAKAFLPELDLVAEADGRIVGNIMYARAAIEDTRGQRHPVILFGPLSVLPAYQRQGVGSALIQRSTALARAAGHRAVLIYGDPAYYSRFGFRPASAFGITPPDGTPHRALQALPLLPGGLDGIAGRFFEDAVYQVDPVAAAAFDAQFPPKEKGFLESQRRFAELSGKGLVSPQ